MFIHTSEEIATSTVGHEGVAEDGNTLNPTNLQQHVVLLLGGADPMGKFPFIWTQILLIIYDVTDKLLPHLIHSRNNSSHWVQSGSFSRLTH